VNLSSTQCALCTVSVFFVLHFTYFGVRTYPKHPPACGPDSLGRMAHSACGQMCGWQVKLCDPSLTRATLTKCFRDDYFTHCKALYTTFQKNGDIKLMAVTLLIQFSTDSQFFSLPDSQENLQQSVKDPTAPHMHRYTTL